MSVSELKEQLRVAGLSQVGDKQTLVFRLKLFATAKEYNMNYDGINVCQLKAADLKKAASKHGVSPIGSNDEILAALVEYLKSKGKSADQQASALPQVESNNAAVNPVAVAQRVLQLAEDGDEEGILNIATTKDSRISKNSPVASMRKAYLKLSLLIHPDKIGRQYEHSTKAFQALVKAFEHLSSPDLMSVDEEDSGSRSKKKQKEQKDVLSLARSNEGCYRTRICCPRCKQPWSEGSVDGNPDYFYNFMMTGLKQFTCSTCLCEFGCMTGLHRCPSCMKPFEYCPQDYHRKITCGNAKCSKIFGFYMYHVSERAVKELKKTIREEQELLIRNREAKMRRAQRSSSKRSELSLQEEENAFTLGLIDCCPRCGESFEGYPEEDLQREHLVECMDDNKHAQFKAQRLEKQRKEQERAAKADKQQSVQSRAAWELLGSETSQLYLLDDTQIRSLAVEKGCDVDLSESTSKAEIIAAVASSSSTGGRGKNSSSLAGPLLGNGESSSSREIGSARKRIAITPQSLPSGYQNFSLAQLEALCASYGFIPPPQYSKGDILDAIEAEIYSHEEVAGRSQRGRGDRRESLENKPAMAATLLLGNGGGDGGATKSSGKRAAKRKAGSASTERRKKIVVESDEEDEDSDYIDCTED